MRPRERSDQLELLVRRQLTNLLEHAIKIPSDANLAKECSVGICFDLGYLLPEVG